MSFPPFWLSLALYLLFINALSLGLYAWDKRQSRAGGWRVKERNLLVAAFVGGSPMSLLAQRWLKHKNRKQPFQNHFRMILIFQMLMLIATGVLWSL